VPVIAVVLIVFWSVAGKRMMGATDRRYGDYKVGALAQRMGLQVLEGNPELNMIQAQTKHNMTTAQRPTGGRVARMLGDADKETRVRMEGAPYGRPTQFVFYSYTKVQDREDPRLGPHLAPVGGGLTGHKYVHIQGQGHVLSSLAEENATMYATFDIEQTQQVLEHMANALAGPIHRR
jgi:hypothetical protein